MSTENEELLDAKPEKEKTEEINWETYIEDFSRSKYTKSSYYNENDEFNYENIISKEITLQEHLLFQYNFGSLLKKCYQ